MVLPRPSEGNIKTAAQLKADVTERVRTANLDERTEWPHSPFMRNISFPEFFSLDLPLSKLIDPRFSTSQQGLEETEEAKALKQILRSDAVSPLDLSPKALKDRFRKGKWGNDTTLYTFRAATALQNAQGENVFYYLLVRSIGSKMIIRQFLSSIETESRIREARLSAEIAEEHIEPSELPFISVGGPAMIRLMDEVISQRSAGRNVNTVLSELPNSKQLDYKAALNGILLLKDRGINILDLRKVSFRITGKGERDLVCKIKFWPESAYKTNSITINVAELDKNKYPLISFRH